MTPDDQPFASDEESAIKAQEQAARLANPGWEIWPTNTYKHGWQWQAIPPTALTDTYMELAGEKNSEHWPVWGEIPPGGYLLGFGSISELQEAMDEVTIRAANPPAWRSAHLRGAECGEPGR